MLTLVIGDKNLSSWSLRPWLLLKHTGLEFRELKLKLDTPEFKSQISQYSGTLRVPILLDGELRIADSLAIAEYLNEKVAGRAWPTDPALRAHARSISAEMHSGFSALRQTWPMKTVGKNPYVPLSPEARADVARIDQIWQDCRTRHSSRGPWLFGEFSIADAMYAPVVLRFNHYGDDSLALAPASTAYLQHVLHSAHMQSWIRDAQEEVAGR
jgi:glutathione S-transferase